MLNGSPIRSRRSPTGTVLSLMVTVALAGCDAEAVELVQEIGAARGDCSAEGLRASDEECVRMMERYAVIGTELVHTYIGGIKALDQALDRMPPPQFDTAGLGYAISPEFRAGDAGGAGSSPRLSGLRPIGPAMSRAGDADRYVSGGGGYASAGAGDRRGYYTSPGWRPRTGQDLPRGERSYSGDDARARALEGMRYERAERSGYLDDYWGYSGGGSRQSYGPVYGADYGAWFGFDSSNRYGDPAGRGYGGYTPGYDPRFDRRYDGYAPGYGQGYGYGPSYGTGGYDYDGYGDPGYGYDGPGNPGYGYDAYGRWEARPYDDPGYPGERYPPAAYGDGYGAPGSSEYPQEDSGDYEARGNGPPDSYDDADPDGYGPDGEAAPHRPAPHQPGILLPPGERLRRPWIND